MKNTNKLVILHTNTAQQYLVKHETETEMCLESRIDGKLSIVNKKQVGVYETKDELTNKES